MWSDAGASAVTRSSYRVMSCGGGLRRGGGQEEEELVYAEHKTETVKRPDIHKERKSVFDKWTEKLKEFLDNA